MAEHYLSPAFEERLQRLAQELCVDSGRYAVAQSVELVDTNQPTLPFEVAD